MAPVAAPVSSVANAPSCILLDVRAYGAARHNATTADSKTSTGLPIEVTFFTEQPPVLSHFSVHCPGLQPQESTDSPTPKVIATDADLVLLRVPIDPRVLYDDYFVYVAHPQHPKLELLPNLSHDRLGDKEIAILRCADDQEYAVAALKINPFSNCSTLYLYRPKPDGEQGTWTVQHVSSEEPTIFSIPDMAQRLMYHVTTKVITPGGSKGTVGWVDLWHGILLCDVLDKSPKFRYMLLPPTRSNRGPFLNHSDDCYRDIIVSQHKDSIKYVEMLIAPPSLVTAIPSGTPDPDSYLEWMRRRECLSRQMRPSLVPGRWKIMTWSMPISSWGKWCIICKASSVYTSDDNLTNSELLYELSCSHKDKEQASQATLSLGSLCMAYPTIDIDDDVVYLLTKAASAKYKTGIVVTALDVKKNNLQGVAKLDSNIFTRCYLASGISKYLSTTGTYALVVIYVF
ncbi:hypothetical protein PR202_ga26769 [Eleusine coracana subsp. coracana]|uniref:DUF1618 domain-containing protein n=1 Tax=Eleusine coracana subsp. coracana TaxID=191504 RepID=A0AAV5DEY0_ELECO|nr:hypothetical protein PR202_ga26769 [Eleusine coracana subsp. coracana]